jgi:hypothetical protein
MWLKQEGRRRAGAEERVVTAEALAQSFGIQILTTRPQLFQLLTLLREVFSQALDHVVDHAVCRLEHGEGRQ